MGKRRAELPQTAEAHVRVSDQSRPVLVDIGRPRRDDGETTQRKPGSVARSRSLIRALPYRPWQVYQARTKHRYVRGHVEQKKTRAFQAVALFGNNGGEESGGKEGGGVGGGGKRRSSD